MATLILINMFALSTSRILHFISKNQRIKIVHFRSTNDRTFSTLADDDSFWCHRKKKEKKAIERKKKNQIKTYTFEIFNKIV